MVSETKEGEAARATREIKRPVLAHSTPGEPRHHGWRWRTASVLSGVLIFTLISLWAYSPFWELALRSDNAPVAWLSSALLFACAAQAWESLAQHKLPRGRARVLVAALVAMALDEQFGFHEYWKYRCAEWTSWCARATPGQVHGLGDAPMAMVAIVGVLVGVVLALGTHFGHLSGALAAQITRLEEVFEVLAEALFFCALVELNALPRLQRQVQSSS